MKTRNTLTILLSFFALMSKAQYPFEKFTAIKYKEYKTWKTIAYSKDSLPSTREISVADFYGKKTSLKIKQYLKMSFPDSIEYSALEIYWNNKLVKAFKVGTSSISEPLPVFKEDINGDGLNDLKIIVPNYGCGAFNYHCKTIFLFQQKNGTFKEIIYTDIFEEFENKPERDLNNDGKYEIITQTFQHFGKHNYWLFNIYNYKNGKLMNVNNLAGYPIMIPLNSQRVSTKISRKKMKEFEISSPAE